MKLFDLLNEVKIDNMTGIGEVPDNKNVDYLGLRVLMKPSVFLSLASTLYREQASSVDYIKSQLAQGQGIASPWLVITVPQEWDDNDFSQPAKVAGHEGRNRMYAVLETEGDVPVETHLFFGGGLRSRHIKPEWIEALNKSLVPQRRTSPVPGPFFEMDKKLDERKGAPGTLKAKITRLYGGDVTCSKTQKLKTRKGATTLDKRQANWFQNKHCGGATRVDEIISGGAVPGDWKKYGSGDAEMFETEFEFQKHKITISVSRDWAQSGAYVLMKKNIEPKADLIGREIIFRVDGETDPTGLLGTGAAGVMSTVVGKIVGLLHSITWDYLVFAGAGDSRQRLYTKILERLAPVLDAEPMQFGDWFLLVKNHLLSANVKQDKLVSFTNLDESLSYKGLRPGANIWYEPGMQYSQYNLYPGKSIVGQRVYHITNKLKSIVKSGGLKPKYDETGAREFGRYSTTEYPFTPVIAIFFDVGEPDWFGKYILSWEITPEDKTARAYMPVDTMQPSDRDNLLPNCQVTPVSIDRITITDLKGNLIKV